MSTTTQILELVRALAAIDATLKDLRRRADECLPLSPSRPTPHTTYPCCGRAWKAGREYTDHLNAAHGGTVPE